MSVELRTGSSSCRWPDALGGAVDKSEFDQGRAVIVAFRDCQRSHSPSHPPRQPRPKALAAPSQPFTLLSALNGDQTNTKGGDSGKKGHTSCQREGRRHSSRQNCLWFSQLWGHNVAPRSATISIPRIEAMEYPIDFNPTPALQPIAHENIAASVTARQTGPKVVCVCLDKTVVQLRTSSTLVSIASGAAHEPELLAALHDEPSGSQQYERFVSCSAAPLTRLVPALGSRARSQASDWTAAGSSRRSARTRSGSSRSVVRSDTTGPPSAHRPWIKPATSRRGSTWVHAKAATSRQNEKAWGVAAPRVPNVLTRANCVPGEDRPLLQGLPRPQAAPLLRVRQGSDARECALKV